MEKGEPWHIRYRTYVSDVLYLVAGIERQAGESGLPFHGVVNASTGEPGTGLKKETRIVTKRVQAEAVGT
jgi:hypothetical protein